MNDRASLLHRASQLRLWPAAGVRPLGSIAIGVAAIFGLLSPAAHAAFGIRVTAADEFQYNSNVFDLASGQPVPGSNDYRHGDWYDSYGADLETNYVISRQDLYAGLSATEFHYDHFTQLSHSEYHFEGGLNWKVGSDLDGNLDVLRTRTMVAFTELVSSTLAVNTEQRETAAIGLNFLTDWRIDANVYTRTLQEPLPGAPDLSLLEQQGQLSLKYLGVGSFTAGVSGTYTHGSFSDTANTLNPAYRQVAGGVVASYTGGAHTTVNAAFGYSDRTSPSGINNVSGTTGDLEVNEKIAEKTSFELRVDRAINSYLTDNGSEIDTDAAATLTWQATFKSSFALGYTYTLRYLPGQGVIPGTSRTDHLQYASVAIVWNALDWLQVKPYANVQTRSTDVQYGNFNSSVYGVQLNLTWQNGVLEQAAPAACATTRPCI